MKMFNTRDIFNFVTSCSIIFFIVSATNVSDFKNTVDPLQPNIVAEVIKFTNDGRADNTQLDINAGTTSNLNEKTNRSKNIPRTNSQLKDRSGERSSKYYYRDEFDYYFTSKSDYYEKDNFFSKNDVSFRSISSTTVKGFNTSSKNNSFGIITELVKLLNDPIAGTIKLKDEDLRNNIINISTSEMQNVSTLSSWHNLTKTNPTVLRNLLAVFKMKFNETGYEAEVNQTDTIDDAQIANKESETQQVEYLNEQNALNLNYDFLPKNMVNELDNISDVFKVRMTSLNRDDAFKIQKIILTAFLLGILLLAILMWINYKHSKRNTYPCWRAEAGSGVSHSTYF